MPATVKDTEEDGHAGIRRMDRPRDPGKVRPCRTSSQSATDDRNHVGWQGVSTSVNSRRGAPVRFKEPSLRKDVERALTHGVRPVVMGLC